MNLSKNILVIQAINTLPSFSDESMEVNCELIAEIEFYCSVKGNCFRKLEIKSEGFSRGSDFDAIRDAIQNFIDGNVITNDKVSANAISESIVSNKIHSINVQLPEPFKSFFNDLFDVSKWEISKKELSN